MEFPVVYILWGCAFAFASLNLLLISVIAHTKYKLKKDFYDVCQRNGLHFHLPEGWRLRTGDTLLLESSIGTPSAEIAYQESVPFEWDGMANHGYILNEYGTWEKCLREVTVKQINGLHWEISAYCFERNGPWVCISGLLSLEEHSITVQMWQSDDLHTLEVDEFFQLLHGCFTLL